MATNQNRINWKADIQISRRKRCHAITDDQSEVIFWAYNLGEVLEWIRDKDLTRVEVETDQGRFALDIHYQGPKE